MASTGGRAPPSQNRPMRPAQDLPRHCPPTNGGQRLGLATLPVLSLGRLCRLGHLGRHARQPPAVDLRLLDPFVQGLGSTTDLRRDRQDRRPPGLVPALVIQRHPHRALAHLTRMLVRRLAHDAPSHSGGGASGRPGALQPCGKASHAVSGSNQTTRHPRCLSTALQARQFVARSVGRAGSLMPATHPLSLQEEPHRLCATVPPAPPRHSGFHNAHADQGRLRLEPNCSTEPSVAHETSKVGLPLSTRCITSRKIRPDPARCDT